MLRIIAPLLTCVLLFAQIGVAGRSTDAVTYTCNPIAYPDGNVGVAEVRVEDTGSSVDVVVDYYSRGGTGYLGRFHEIGSEEAPSDDASAYDYAVRNYFYRQ